jgi:hypothetical protein
MCINKMHLVENNIKIQHVFTLHKILNAFCYKNVANLVIFQRLFRVLWIIIVNKLRNDVIFVTKDNQNMFV